MAATVAAVASVSLPAWKNPGAEATRNLDKAGILTERCNLPVSLIAVNRPDLSFRM